MSHIPTSAMPHAKVDGDTTDDQPSQPGQKQAEPDPTVATPLTSQAPATATGNRAGSAGDRTAREAGQPQTSTQAPVDGIVTAQDRPSRGEKPERRSGLRSPVGIAALAIGGLAVVGGVAAALFPSGRGEDKDTGKSKKRRRKSA